MSGLFLILCLFFLNASVSASEDFWLNLEETTDAVSDGELRFLANPPKNPVHHHFNTIRVTEESLESGWVQLRQCHFNLDPVHELEILYRTDAIRHLRIVSSEKVGSARVKGATVQLSDIQRQGQICIQAESRALRREGEGYLLQNGPYMRRFLDGYYPMQITVELTVPETVRIWKVTPDKVAGLNIEVAGSTARVDGWFEGVLYTRIWMCRKADTDCRE